MCTCSLMSFLLLFLLPIVTSIEKPSKGICEKPRDSGPCYGKFLAYSYNSTSHSCEPFIYGGCQGNENRFSSHGKCMKTCVDLCSQPRESGPCNGNISQFFYNQSSQFCEPFIYGGCEGNDNRFDSIELCEENCKIDNRSESYNHISSICTPHSNDIINRDCEGEIKHLNISVYYYNTYTGSCDEIWTSDCKKAQENGFESKEKCLHKCKHLSICHLPYKVGPCKGSIKSYYYNSTNGTCDVFYYGGCHGNENRFITKEECSHRCIESHQKSICDLPSKVGPCKGSIKSYYYNSTNGTCDVFYYGGCDGNENRFKDEKECSHRCIESHQKSICDLPSKVGPCKARIDSYYYNSINKTCDIFYYGGCHGNENRFITKEECSHKCIESHQKSICDLPSKVGPCEARIESYYYNSLNGTCDVFYYGGCHGNQNRFNTKEQCIKKCVQDHSYA